MTRREVICGETWGNAQSYATDVGLGEDEWDWCQSCADSAELDYPSEEE